MTTERRESSRSRERKDAARLLRQRLGEVATGAVHAPAPRRTRTPAVMMHDLFDLVEKHYTKQGCTSPANGFYLNMLRRRFGSYRVEACTSVAIEDYMEERQKAGRRPETINRQMDVLRTAFRLGYRHDLIQREPYIESLQERGVRSEFFYPCGDRCDAALPAGVPA